MSTAARGDAPDGPTFGPVEVIVRRCAIAPRLSEAAVRHGGEVTIDCGDRAIGRDADGGLRDGRTDPNSPGPVPGGTVIRCTGLLGSESLGL